MCLRVEVCLYERVGETATTATAAAVAAEAAAAIGTWNLSAHVKTRAKNSNYMHWARFQMHNR